MMRRFLIAVVIGGAVSFSGAALAWDHFDVFGEGWAASHARQPRRQGRQVSENCLPDCVHGAPQDGRVYHWPDSRYYGRHGMVLD